MKEPTWSERLAGLSAAIRIQQREVLVRFQLDMLKRGNKEAADAFDDALKELQARFE